MSERMKTDCCDEWREKEKTAWLFDADGLPDVLVCRDGRGCDAR